MIRELWGSVWSLAFLVGVIGNLTAALLWAVPALRKLHKKIDANHAEHMRLLRGHNTTTVSPTAADQKSDPLTGKDRPAA
jgi:hypothetical protein